MADQAIPDNSALHHMFVETYAELRRLAAVVRRGDMSETLNPTALVNEAYLKLAGSLRTTPLTRLHFKRIAARAMRQVLIEAARRRHAQKRGGAAELVTYHDTIEGAPTTSDELLALDEALDALARQHPRQAAVVEYRYFGGLDQVETAELLGISESTVVRDWRAARAWLARELGARP
jgi:RNA polymerase sigma-70 factor, ECF subfamily